MLRALRKDTLKEPDATRVKLVNTGHIAFDSLGEVIILLTRHRIDHRDDIGDAEAVAYSERGH